MNLYNDKFGRPATELYQMARSSGLLTATAFDEELEFTYFFLWAPSGLVAYWLVNNILGIGQQYFVNRHTKRAAQSAG